ncbi:ATP-dependent zinc metalloprotease FtsH [Planctomycetes bacterium CA13]|uniref:Uncharacterized AAA domain-containing protein ycf46 n=2 Tax=Novipirellula herctigrandis TaxID=2527986 RepID=A0A5C5Z4N0_9BACT|nr:ATP-dependent zinc metalloprotease FtsH [Planctomycetes bacterium CA13]
MDQPSRKVSVPDWYPGWAREMANLYFAANTCVFVLHGNVNDLYHCRVTTKGKTVDQFCGLTDFLSLQIFGAWDLVTSYDMGQGIQAQAGADQQRHRDMMAILATNIGSPTTWTRSPDDVLTNYQRMIQRNLLEDSPADRKRIAFLFPYAQFLVPAAAQSSIANTQASHLVRFLSWAQNPYIKRVNMAICLITETLNDLNKRLVEDPHVATIDIPLPSDSTRRVFIETSFDMEDSESADAESENQQNSKGMSVASITQVSNGLNLVNLNVAMSRSKLSGKSVDVREFRRLKKDLIERQCHDLVTFLEPTHTLDMVVGHTAAKDRLKLDAKWIVEGQLDSAPMGYLICGPVGTGKTFISECYAGSIGIPCLVLKNFRSKYVGETEGNLEKVLSTLRSLGPVVVIIDEADAALGNRESGGDSGTSNRVFSMIASQMGNTRFRGKIIWMLLTSRPELLPIDLKRQGRAEVHIPLFYPKEESELKTMFAIMGKKNKVVMADDAIPDVSIDRELSGADIESIVLGAKREMMAENRTMLTRADMQLALDSFIPSAQGMEKQLQELVAVLECTDRRFLTAQWREELSLPNGRAVLQKKVAAIQEYLGRD